MYATMAACQKLLRSSLWRLHCSVGLRLGTPALRSNRCFSILSDDEYSPRGPLLTTELSKATIAHKSDHLTPIYRVMDNSGKVLDSSQEPKLSEDLLLKMYRQMVTLEEMDDQLYKAQRMGLISFYMMCSGEEATHFGPAAALELEDMVYAQYREAGVLLWRGFTLDDCMNQCFSNHLDTGKGRQMPVHYGSKELNYQFISSCLSTQMPQASGYAYGLKLAKSKSCVMVYFGDGAAQEGDSHAAMNFAATLKCPIIFMCRNNGYAISTPVEDQYAGDGIVTRGIGYGMEALRVDGNDVLALYNATRHARHVAISEQRPVLIEAFTYRISSHSTSDEQKQYQDMDMVELYGSSLHPIRRLRGYLEQRGLWGREEEEALRGEARAQVRESMQAARRQLKPHIHNLFQDVYDKLPSRLEKQRREMMDHLHKYKDQYPLDLHEQ